MAGYLLARAGVPVIVLEKHADFFRDFRGDTIHPSTLELMYELGLLDEFLKQRAKDPPFAGEIVFQPMAPHCWGPRGPELFGKMGNHIDKRAPAGADLKSWRY